MTALLTMLIVTVIASLFMTSLMGEIQGENAYHEAVMAMSMAEAGLHWAGNRLTGSAGSVNAYPGDNNQTVRGAGGQQVGVFDVAVTCTYTQGNSGIYVSPSSDQCSSNPNQRYIIATGFVPSRAGVQAQRTVQALVSQNTFFKKTLCAYDSVTVHQGVTVRGDVGSEGAGSPDITFQGNGRTRPSLDGSQPGTAKAVTDAQCNGGTCNPGQVSGGVQPSQQPGSVCPNRTQVWNSITCTPGGVDFGGGELVITHATSSNYKNIDIPDGGNTLTFVTTGPADVLTVQVNSISVGDSGSVVVQGGGTVILNVNSQLVLNNIGNFGVDPQGNAVPASHMVVQSCNTGAPSPAIEFNRAAMVSGVFLVPYGTVHLNQATQSQGAILAQTIDVEQSTTFAFEPTALNVGLGFNHLLSWQDVP